jgi:hypothetical protein
MPKVKLTKTVVDGASSNDRDYELRDTVVPGFLVKITPAGRKIFMLAYVAQNGQRRKPAIGRYGEITVEQARGIAQDWLAEVRRGYDPERGAGCVPPGADGQRAFRPLYLRLFGEPQQAFDSCVEPWFRQAPYHPCPRTP